jgi:hypothetical protein
MATTQKSVQIPAELFVQLINYHLYERRDPELAERIRKGLDEKLEALARRQLYTDYKAGNEAARQAYLDAAGIDEDWRW